MAQLDRMMTAAPQVSSIMHDPHVRPPSSVRDLFKEWRKRPATQIASDPTLIDPRNPDLTRVSSLLQSVADETADLENASRNFCQHLNAEFITISDTPPGRPFEVNGLPGTFVVRDSGNG